MRILVTGQGKSGTTALFFALKQSIPKHFVCLFEPMTLDVSDPDILAKIIIGNPMPTRLADFEGFDKKILIIRDPRDNLVSRLMYLPYGMRFYSDDGKVSIFLDMLKRKRQAPADVSILEFLELLSEWAEQNLIERIVNHHKFSFEIATQRPDYFVFRYEDLVANRFAELEQFLGLPISFNGQVDSDFQRVVRKKETGDWRNWFTQQDIAFWEPIYRDFISRFDYDSNWAIAGPQMIDEEHSTKYVIRLIEEKRAIDAHRLTA